MKGILLSADYTRLLSLYPFFTRATQFNISIINKNVFWILKSDTLNVS